MNLRCYMRLKVYFSETWDDLFSMFNGKDGSYFLFLIIES